MYKVGQKINIGYYGGFHNQTLVKTQAEITKISATTGLIYMKANLSGGGCKKMFGYESELKKMEENYV